MTLTTVTLRLCQNVSQGVISNKKNSSQPGYPMKNCNLHNMVQI